MKNYIFYTFSLILLVSCNNYNNNSKIILEANGFPDSTKIYITNIETETRDSGYIVNNKLIFLALVEEPSRFSINTVYTSRENLQHRSFWKENKPVIIKIEKGNLNDARIEGSEIQKTVDLLDASKAILNRKLDSIINEYKAIPMELTEKRQAVRAEGQKIEKAINETDVNFIRTNPNELYSAITLKNLMQYTIPKDLTRELYNILTPEIQSTKYGVSVNKYLTLSREVKIGDKAIDFQLPNLENQSVSLSDYQGKYVLLDFWSSNCGPCRMENPNLLRNYKAYRDKGFEIIGICLDKTRETWKNTVKTDSMIWTTVSDLKGFDGDIPMTYSVYFIPTYYLINPDGVIADKIMGRGQLDEKLKAIFDKQ
jgi:peroxiredoxin